MLKPKNVRKTSIWLSSTISHDDTNTNEEILFEGQKNYVSLAICVKFTFTLYKQQNIIEVRAVLVSNKAITDGPEPISILYLSNSLIEESCDISEMEACIRSKKEAFCEKYDIRYATMTPIEILKAEAVRELSVDFIKNRLYVVPSTAFEISLKVFAGDTVDQDGKHTFYVPKNEQVKLVLYRRKSVLLRLPEETNNTTVAADSILLSTGKEPKPSRDWTASLRFLDPSFAKEMLPKVLKAKPNSEILALFKYLAHRLILKCQITLMKRRLERIMIDIEPLPNPYHVPRSHTSENKKKKYKDALEKAKKTRIKLRQILLNNLGSVGERSRRYSFLFQNLAESNPLCPIRKFISGDFNVPVPIQSDDISTTGFKPRKLNQRSASVMSNKRSSTPMAMNALSREGSSNSFNTPGAVISLRRSASFVSSRSQKLPLNVSAKAMDSTGTSTSLLSIPDSSRRSSSSNRPSLSNLPSLSGQSNLLSPQSHDIDDSSKMKVQLLRSLSHLDNVEHVITSALPSNSLDHRRAKRASLTKLIFDKSKLDIDSSSDEDTPNPTTREREEDTSHTIRDTPVSDGIPFLSLSAPPSSLSPSTSSPLLPIDEKAVSTPPYPSKITSQNIALSSQTEPDEKSDSEDDDDNDDDDNSKEDDENVSHRGASPTALLTEENGGESENTDGLGLSSPIPSATPIEYRNLIPIQQRKLNPVERRRASGSQINYSPSLLNGVNVIKAGMKSKVGSESDLNTTNHSQSHPRSRGSSISHVILPIINTAKSNTNITTISTTDVDKSLPLSVPTVRPNTSSTITPGFRPRAKSQPTILSPLASIAKDKLSVIESTGVKTSALSSQSRKMSKEVNIANGSRPGTSATSVRSSTLTSTSLLMPHESHTSIANHNEPSRSNVMLNGLRNGRTLAQLFGDVFGGQNTMSESLKETTDRLVQESVRRQHQQQQQQGLDSLEGDHVVLTLAEAGGEGSGGIVTESTDILTESTSSMEDPHVVLALLAEDHDDLDRCGGEGSGGILTESTSSCTVGHEDEDTKEMGDETDMDGKINN